MKNDRARAVILKDGYLLMIKRLRADNIYYVLPGGKIEEGELPETTVMREVKEETSLDARFIKKLDILTGKDGTLHHIYLCEYISRVLKLTINSPEVAESSSGNTYTPVWVNIKEITGLQVWPEESKIFLLNYLKT